jgi:hypothetical protein
MQKNLGCIKLLLWIGIVLFFLWFLIFCIAPESVLAALTVVETRGYFLRLYGIFPLSWIVLFLFALKDVEKNRAIINAGIITGVFVIISLVVYHFIEGGEGLFHWISAAIMLIYTVLLFIFKPKAAQP